MSVTESKAKAPVKTSKKSVNPAESAALKAALEAAQVEMVPLSALVKSPLNVRTIPHRSRKRPVAWWSVCMTVSFASSVVSRRRSRRPFSVVRSMEAFNPELISHTLALIACLDTDGYSCASIISTLEQEGAQ